MAAPLTIRFGQSRPQATERGGSGGEASCFPTTRLMSTALCGVGRSTALAESESNQLRQGDSG